MSAVLRMSAREFVDAPVPETGRPWNLVDGEVVVNLPTRRHLLAQDNILVALKHWTRGGPDRGSAGSALDVELDGCNVFAPDIHWYAAGRIPEPGAAPPYAMPDLAVEVRSPGTWRFDLGAKKAGYERHGLPELWLVDTDARKVLVYRRSKAAVASFDVALDLHAGERLVSPLLPGFALPVADVFGAR